MLSSARRQLRQCAGVAHLDLLGFRRRRAQHVRDVVGDLVAGDRQAKRCGGSRPARTPRCRWCRRRCRPARRRVRARRRSARRCSMPASDRIRSSTCRPQRLHALGDVGGGRLRAGHQVRVHFQAHAGHADRIADAFLRVVDDVFLRDRMQDALVGGNRRRPSPLRARGRDRPRSLRRR